jgi:hypothetical protein
VGATDSSLASPTSVTSAPDLVEDALGDALAAWRADHDPRALRCALLALITGLDEST